MVPPWKGTHLPALALPINGLLERIGLDQNKPSTFRLPTLFTAAASRASHRLMMSSASPARPLALSSCAV
jgi:hypothetical protein